MRRMVTLLLLSLSLLACASGARPGSSPLAGRLEPFFHRSGVTVAVAYRDLGTGATYFRISTTTTSTGALPRLTSPCCCPGGSASSQ